MERLQPILAAIWRGIIRTWQRGRWGKIAVVVGAFVLSCCGATLIGAVLPQPRTAAPPTPAASRVPAVAAESTSAATAAPEPTSAPSATPAPPTAIPATSTVVRERGVMFKADLGAQWPLTVDAIRLRCVNGRELVFDADGTTYALNGTAKGTKRYADLGPIWRDDPLTPGLKISLQPLLDMGLPLCS